MSTSVPRSFGETSVTAYLVGYEVEALDGSIGEVDEATDDLDASFIALKTGPACFGKRVVLPASVIDRVDHDARKVFLNRAGNEIENAPAYKRVPNKETDYTALTRYYQPDGSASREAAASTQASKGDVVFAYRLVDLGGRDVDVVERETPLRADDRIVTRSGEAWRIVGLLGKSATVTRA